MTVLSRATGFMALALLFALAAAGAAQSPPQSAPQSPATQEQPPAAPGAKSQPEPKKRQAHRRPRTNRPQRTSKPRRPPDAPAPFEETRRSREPGPTTHGLTLTANAMGGYDGDITTSVESGSLFPTAMVSGSIGYMDAGVGYFHGNLRRSVSMETRGNLLANPSGHLAAGGGLASIGATTTVRRTTTFGASEQLRYEPFFSFLTPAAAVAPAPSGIIDMLPTTGLFERHTLLSGTSVSVERLWSDEDSTSLSYSYGAGRFDDHHGDYGAQDVLAEYRRVLARSVRARVAYRYVDSTYSVSAGTEGSLREQRIEGGPEIEKALSRRQNLTLSFAGGASYGEAPGSPARPAYRSWLPVGGATATIGLSPRWVIEGGYRRSFSLLQGLTDKPYTTDSAFVTTRRFITSRTDLRIDATYSNWKTLLVPGVDDRLKVYGVSLRASVALNASIAATAGYYYYYHRYSNPADLPVGFPAEYERNALRFGLTMWLPLVGTSSTSPLLPR